MIINKKNIEDDEPYEDIEIETNRSKKLKSKLGFHYCYACDQALVSCGGKCPNCGHKAHKRRFKK